MPAIIVALLALILGFLAAASALAAPGEPRLIQGTLEWPPELASQKFVVVRTDGGDFCYVDVSSAQRRMQVTLTGGARIALLGIEGAKPQEITALAISGGDAAALARAITAGTATEQASAGTKAATPTPGGSPGSPSALPTAAATAQPTAPAPPSGTESKPAAPAGQATPPAPAPAPNAPASSVVAPGPAASSVIASTAGSDVVASGASAPGAPSGAATVPSAAGRRWTEIRGVVEKVGTDGLQLRGDDGSLITVEVARLNANFAEHIKPGMVVAVYGHPVETKFSATGVMYSEGPAPAPSRSSGEPARKRAR